MFERMGCSGRPARVAAFTVLAAFAVALAMSGTAVAAKEKTVWLCKPGKKPDPCQESRNSTTVTYTGNERHEAVVEAGKAKPPIDCFYVYPTVSEQEGPNANLDDRTAGDAGRDRPGLALLAGVQGLRADVPAADAEGDQRSDHPGRRGQGLHGRGSAPSPNTWPSSTRAAPFVLIGHSQGCVMLENLIHVRGRSQPRAAQTNSSPRSSSGATCSFPKASSRASPSQHEPLCTSADRHRLRDRVLDVPQRTARKLVLRQAGEPAARRRRSAARPAAKSRA